MLTKIVNKLKEKLAEACLLWYSPQGEFIVLEILMLWIGVEILLGG